MANPNPRYEAHAYIKACLARHQITVYKIEEAPGEKGEAIAYATDGDGEPIVRMMTDYKGRKRLALIEASYRSLGVEPAVEVA